MQESLGVWQADQNRKHIAGKRGKALLAPVLFKGSTNALWFNQWLEKHLIPELKPNSTLILDNAQFHRKDDVFRIAEQAGHKVLFLPPYLDNVKLTFVI